MTRTTCALLLVLAATTAASADDEASEHTATLAGAPADTLGVTVEFDDATGWEMTVRPRPGADEHTYQLAIPKRHAHYVAYVAAHRAAITFVEVSAGVTTGRPRPRADDTLAWTWSPDGKLVRRWSYRELLTAKERAAFGRSISHYQVTAGMRSTAAGLELAVAGSARPLVIDAATGALRRR